MLAVSCSRTSHGEFGADVSMCWRYWGQWSAEYYYCSHPGTVLGIFEENCSLCDLRQITQHFCAFISSPVKWKSCFPPPQRLAVRLHGVIYLRRVLKTALCRASVFSWHIMDMEVLLNEIGAWIFGEGLCLQYRIMWVKERFQGQWEAAGKVGVCGLNEGK